MRKTTLRYITATATNCSIKYRTARFSWSSRRRLTTSESDTSDASTSPTTLGARRRSSTPVSIVWRRVVAFVGKCIQAGNIVANPFKASLLSSISARFGRVTALAGSKSLFAIGDDAALLYVRYSQVHRGNRTFFGLRQVDLRRLEGRPSFLCFLLNDNSEPVFVPYSAFEEVFRDATPANDGQYKVQLLTTGETLELYVARQRRFNVDGFVGIEFLGRQIDASRLRDNIELSHRQVQTLLCGIGVAKGFDVWIPRNDVPLLDWTLTAPCDLCPMPPPGFDSASSIVEEIDVVWIHRGGSKAEAFFEVEHSTPVYSALLRFNDALLIRPALQRFYVVANDARRGLFARQVNRPTFRRSGLSDVVSFLEYANVFDWHRRTVGGAAA